MVEARISQVELTRRLQPLGEARAYPTVSAKLARGTFSAGFMLKAFFATGASAIDLPPRHDDGRGGRADGPVPGSGRAHVTDIHVRPLVRRGSAEYVRPPTDDPAWQALADEIVRNALAVAGVTRADLFWRLRRIGVHLTVKEIGRRLDHSALQAPFMLQVLIALGAESIELPSSSSGIHEGDG